METVLIQICNNKAYKLLEIFEDMHILKVLKKKKKDTIKLSEKYAGKLPSDIADDMQNYVRISRDLADSFNDVKLHQDGKIELKSAKDLLNEL